MASIWNHLRTVLLAAAIALLVWLYAEGESLASRTVLVNLSLPSAAGAISSSANPAGVSDVLFQPDDPSFRGTLRIRMEGTSRTVDDAVNLIGTTVRLLPGMPGMPTDSGERKTLDVLQALNALPELQGLGSSVVEVEPRYITVRVLRLVQRELTLRVELGADVQLDGDPTPAQSAVMIRLPESALPLLGEPGGPLASAVVSVSEGELRRIRGDGPQTVTGTVKLPSALAGLENVQIIPESMPVALRIRRKVDSVKVVTVPVWFSLPPTEDAGRWIVELQDKFLTDITLTGPSDEIRRISSGETRVKALVELGTEELDRAISSKSVTFPGLSTAVVATGQSTIVRFKIQRRDASDPSLRRPPSVPAP